MGDPSSSGLGPGDRPSSEGTPIAVDAILAKRVRELRKELYDSLARLAAAEVSSRKRRSDRITIDDSAPLGYVVLDSAGIIRGANRTFCEMIGKNPSQVAGWPLSSAVAKPDRKLVLSHLWRCRQGRVESGHVTTEVLLERRGVPPRPVQLLSNRVRSSREGVFQLPTAVIDISARYEMESALRANQRRLEAAVEASGVAVFEHDVPFTGEGYASDRCAALLGYRSDEIPHGAALLDWLAARADEEGIRQVKSLYADLESGRSDKGAIELQLRHRDEGWRYLRVWTRISGFSSSDDDGRTLVGVVMDVTKDKQNTLEAQRQAKQLRRLATDLHEVEERERRQIASDLHDDLAQVIAATQMKVSAMAMDPASEPVRDDINEALALVDRADRSVRSVIFQVSPPVLEELGLTPALEWLAKDLKQQFGLDVGLEAADNLPYIDRRIRFILFRAARELLVNVAKHAKTPRARIALERRAAEEGTDEAQSRVRIVVSDDGRGFDPSALHEDTGHGFGLLRIRERLESIGGDVEISSSPGRGTSISMVSPTGQLALRELASARLPERAGTTGRQAARERDHPLRLLLVDDHALIRSAIARMLAASPGVEVVGEASDGKAAVALAAKLAPDVILMDVTMPGMGGIEATRRISESHPQIRIIGLSMHESEEVMSEMRKAGASDFLKKSEPAARLIAAIRAD